MFSASSTRVLSRTIRARTSMPPGEHARQCATCGPALEAAAALTADLAALPQPAPPPDLAAVVLARIAQIEPVPLGS